ncbi:MAG: two-component system, OmpR family, phosphate regulon sensor histidine kinase PhoR [Blastocatellia bacterium]|nr:two-component system, OmpR family, phosphate regulon sensor histidine kinase PhoR [Blastocatellia bacterium]
MSNSKRNILVVVGFLVAAVLLLLPSFTLRSSLAVILFAAGGVLLLRELLGTKSFNPTRRGADDLRTTDRQSTAEVFTQARLFEATINGMREGLLVVDRDMRVVASNAAAHRLFNSPRGNLDDQRLTEITRNPAIYGAFLDALKGHERSEVRVETHGPERVFDLRVVPLGGDHDKNGGGEDGALGVFIDVTRIERLERVRQEFLSNISHDLRTPLTAIMAFVETLETGALDDKENSLRFLSIIRRNAARMHDLIDDLLELSAIEAGNVQVRPELIELRPIVNDVLSLLETNAAARNVVLTNEIAPEATVFADARRLEQMLTNLVDNAIKFNRENGAVTVRLERNPEAGASHEGTVASDRILVEDTGEGIPAQHLARLFERFYRVDRARSQDMGGTGLGLAIVKHLARAHGGGITVTSEVGKGTTLAIELPIKHFTAG